MWNIDIYLKTFGIGYTTIHASHSAEQRRAATEDLTLEIRPFARGLGGGGLIPDISRQPLF